MRSFTLVMAVIAFLVATVMAAASGTNAERMARGLPPKPPRRLYREPTPASPARRSSPSGSPSSCSTGPVQCCNTVTTADNSLVSVILGLLGLVLGPDVVVGLECSPISVIGVGAGNSCSSNVVCCQDNSVGGLISIGCIPIFL